jgi:hypothetical protein
VDRLAKRDRDQTGFQTVTSNRNASDLFACKWLRAPATNQTDTLAVRERGTTYAALTIRRSCTLQKVSSPPWGPHLVTSSPERCEDVRLPLLFRAAPATPEISR